MADPTSAEKAAADKAAADKAAADKTAADKTAADKAAADKANSSSPNSNAPNSNATAAAEKKVADAKKALADAEAELAKTGATRATTAAEDAKPKPGAKPVFISGRVGGPFTIDGEGFGTQGELRVGGRTVQTTRWNDRSIKGQLPADLKPGEVLLVTSTGEQHGKFPPDPPPAAPAIGGLGGGVNAGINAGSTVTVKTAKGELVQGEVVTK